MSTQEEITATYHKQEEIAQQQARSAGGGSSGLDIAMRMSLQEAQLQGQRSNSAMNDDDHGATQARASGGGIQFRSSAMGGSAAHSLAASMIGSDDESKVFAIGQDSEHKGTAAAASHSAEIVDLTSGAQAAATSSRRSSTSSVTAQTKALKALQETLARQNEHRKIVATDSASLAKMAGLNKAIGLLIVYNDSSATMDSFRVTVDKSTDALLAGVFDFLKLNQTVLAPWIRLLSGKCSLPESTLLVLHLLLHLHTLQKHGEIFERINISVLASSLLEQSLSDNDGDATMSSENDALLMRWKALEFPGGEDGFIHFRYCRSLTEVTEGVPLRVVYIDSLIWLQQIGDLQTIKQRMQSAFEAQATSRDPPSSPPVILPQPEWEEFVEDKPAVYEKLKEHMLPTLWVSLSSDEIKTIRSKEIEPAAAAAVATSAAASSTAATSSSTPSPPHTIEQMHQHYEKYASEDAKKSVQAICQRLLAGCQDDLTKNQLKKAKHFIKGGFSDCGVCSSSFTFAPSESDPEGYGQLPGLIYIWTRNYGQTSFGRQKKVKGFKKREYRFWFTSGCTPNSAAISWRYACMLQSGVTSLGNSPAITVEQSCVLTPEANACYDLAHALIQTPYIQGFLKCANPMPALRLDCGWNSATGKAFLNEMGVSPGAWLFSECHKLDILIHVAKSLVGFMKPHLQEKPAPVAAAAAAAAGADAAAVAAPAE